MRERPVLCSGAEVRGLLDGSLTTLVRYMKPQPSSYVPGPNVHAPKHDGPHFDAYCSEQKTDANPRGMSDRWCWWSPDDRQGADWIRCPFGQPGDRLYVREKFVLDRHTKAGGGFLHYAADNSVADTDGETHSEPRKAAWDWFGSWQPAQVMPRWVSRLTLEVVNVRAVRSQDGVWNWLVDCRRTEAHIA